MRPHQTLRPPHSAFANGELRPSALAQVLPKFAFFLKAAPLRSLEIAARNDTQDLAAIDDRNVVVSGCWLNTMSESLRIGASAVS